MTQRNRRPRRSSSLPKLIASDGDQTTYWRYSLSIESCSCRAPMKVVSRCPEFSEVKEQEWQHDDCDGLLVVLRLTKVLRDDRRQVCNVEHERYSHARHNHVNNPIPFKRCFAFVDPLGIELKQELEPVVRLSKVSCVQHSSTPAAPRLRPAIICDDSLYVRPGVRLFYCVE